MAIQHADINLQKVLYYIYVNNRSDYVKTYSNLEDDTGLKLSELRKIIMTLKKLNYVETVYAVDDEGYLKGRGFWVPSEKTREVDILCDLLESKGVV